MAIPRTKPWAPEHPPTDLLLKNASIVDVQNGEILGNHSVHLSAGKITSVSPTVPGDAGAQVVDLDGKYILPGLIDCHTHVTCPPGSSTMSGLFDAHPDSMAYRSADTAKRMLLRGFTSARDCAGASFALRDAIAEGLVHGPRLFIAGKALSQTGGHGDLRQTYQREQFKCCGGHGPGLGRVCDGIPACLEAARDELRQGADFLKIMVGGGVASPVDPIEMLQFTPEEVRAITTSAKNLGKYVTAHAYTVEAIRHAVDNGVMGIEHGNFIDKATAEYCAEKGVFVTPTLITYQALLRPPYEQFLPEDGRVKCQSVIDNGIGSLKILHEAGVTICFGTDLLAGMHVFQNEEFEIRAAALSSMEILKSATVNAAKLLRMEGKLGVIMGGAIADLLILDQNPLEDIRVLNRMNKHCFAIVKDGRVVSSRLGDLKRDALYDQA